MKTHEFQALIEQLGDLSEVQRSPLVAALKSNGSANDVIALIETRFAVAPVCGHCRSAAFGSWGVASGLRRYKCKCCSRTFNALTPGLSRQMRPSSGSQLRARRRSPGGAQESVAGRPRRRGFQSTTTTRVSLFEIGRGHG